MVVVVGEVEEEVVVGLRYLAQLQDLSQLSEEREVEQEREVVAL